MGCPWCGEEHLAASERRLLVDRGEVFEEPAPAMQCPTCGHVFVGDEHHSRPTPVPPPRIAAARIRASQR